MITEGTDSKLLLLEISTLIISRNCSLVGCLKCVQFHNENDPYIGSVCVLKKGSWVIRGTDSVRNGQVPLKISILQRVAIAYDSTFVIACTAFVNVFEVTLLVMPPYLKMTPQSKSIF